MEKNTLNTLKVLFLFAAASFFFINNGFAQPALPQRHITVLPTQPIDFGTFCVSGEGSITVDYAGNITTSGGVISVDQTTVTPAIFEIKLCQGRTVTVDYGTQVWLNGSNGGTLELTVGPTEYGPSGTEFPVNNDCNFITVLRVGGTLKVSGNQTSGYYSGSFPMSFIQE